MNIRRGFFRVWIVSSILWIAGVTYSGYQDATHLYPDYDEVKNAVYDSMNDAELIAEAKKEGLQVDDKTSKVTIPPGINPQSTPSPENLGNVKMPDGTVVRNVPVDKEKFKFGDDYGIWKRQHIRKVVSDTAFEAITFPVVTFLIWFIGCWIGTGFRGKKST